MQLVWDANVRLWAPSNELYFSIVISALFLVRSQF